MIYLIITASIQDKYTLSDSDERKKRYFDCISQTLKYLPNTITPIIVENNGIRETFLDNFIHNESKVRVIYTNNNNRLYKNKGVNEFFDIKSVIDILNIDDNDIIIKLTGRYRALSSTFFMNILNDNSKYDAFIKFFGTCSLKFEDYDCILGCYALRAIFFKLFNPIIIDNYKSPEIAFARYMRFCGAKVNEIAHLDIECKFSDDNRVLIV